MKQHLNKAAGGDLPVTRDGERRAFMKKLTAILVGGVASVVPVAAGVVVVFDPVLRQPYNGGFIRVATLDALADDGTPRFFQVIDGRGDVWNPYPKGVLGAVYLRKTALGGVACLSTTCPSGGPLEFIAAKSVFKCSCHNCTFNVDGVRIDPDRCPSPRDIDVLEVDQARLRRTGEVFVRYRNFKPFSQVAAPATSGGVGFLLTLGLPRSWTSSRAAWVGTYWSASACRLSMDTCFPAMWPGCGIAASLFTATPLHGPRNGTGCLVIHRPIADSGT